MRDPVNPYAMRNCLAVYNTAGKRDTSKLNEKMALMEKSYLLLCELIKVSCAAKNTQHLYTEHQVVSENYSKNVPTAASTCHYSPK